MKSICAGISARTAIKSVGFEPALEYRYGRNDGPMVNGIYFSVLNLSMPSLFSGDSYRDTGIDLEVSFHIVDGGFSFDINRINIPTLVKIVSEDFGLSTDKVQFFFGVDSLEYRYSPTALREENGFFLKMSHTVRLLFPETSFVDFENSFNFKLEAENINLKLSPVDYSIEIL